MRKSLFLFESDEFAEIEELLSFLPVTTDRKSREFCRHFLDYAAEVEVNEIEEEDVLDVVKNVPELWEYLKEDKNPEDIRIRLVRLKEYLQKSNNTSTVLKVPKGNPWLIILRE